MLSSNETIYYSIATSMMRSAPTIGKILLNSSTDEVATLIWKRHGEPTLQHLTQLMTTSKNTIRFSTASIVQKK